MQPLGTFRRFELRLVLRVLLDGLNALQVPREADLEGSGATLMATYLRSTSTWTPRDMRV